MTFYNCCRCGYKTYQKQDFKRHLLRKNICKPKLIDIDEITFYQNYVDDFPQVASKIKVTAQKRTNNAQKRTNNIKIHKCDYCGNIFTRKDTVTRHINKYCKVKKQLDEDKLKDKQIIELKKEIKQVKSITNNINNGTINNNVINIVQLGKEDIINKLTDQEKRIILSGGLQSMLPRLVERVHCNDRLPEYKNIICRNLQSKYLDTYDAKTNKFKKVLKSELMEMFLECKKIDLQELCNDTKYKIGDRPKEFVETITKRIDDKENKRYKKYVDEMTDKLILLIYNYYN